MAHTGPDLDRIIASIRESRLTIYDLLDDKQPLYLAADGLQAVLQSGLLGLDLNYPLRTRSKVLKSRVCEILGYPVPKTFRRTRPRFPGQNFDTYVQKANNLQIWNEDVSPSRRYAIIRVDDQHKATAVRVISGEALALLDTTGTLTQKYQAKSISPVTDSTLVSRQDTPFVAAKSASGGLLQIGQLYQALIALVGKSFDDPGADQERNRGGLIHKMVSSVLPGGEHHDTGQFPDVPSQLLEVKFQTSPTIDLGLVNPDSTERVADRPEFRHCDVRYAVFYGGITAGKARVGSLVVCTGQDFFKFFRRFEGKVVNKKIQIHLPKSFFD
ncbi:MAG: restriction endonuclease [Planctomycetes bacterium]|nr:restriction endonuclease [Planctomycetota bacterium]